VKQLLTTVDADSLIQILINGNKNYLKTREKVGLILVVQRNQDFNIGAIYFQMFRLIVLDIADKIGIVSSFKYYRYFQSQ
jgi:predicted regulator of Ras-like GTPase activity (Roadblock/LC7/MglB family)